MWPMTPVQFIRTQPPGTLIWAVGDTEAGERVPCLLMRVYSREIGKRGEPVPVWMRMGMWDVGSVRPVVVVVRILGYMSEMWINLIHDDAREWVALVADEVPLHLSLVGDTGQVERLLVVPSRPIAAMATAIQREVPRPDWTDDDFNRARDNLTARYTLEELWAMLGEAWRRSCN